MAIQKVDTTNSHNKTFSIRVPLHQARIIESIANRDSNSASATIRRLLARALRSEVARRGE